MTVSRIVSIKELPNKQISDTSLFLHNTNDSESKDKNVSVAQVREYLVKPEADRAKKAEADEKARAEKAEAAEKAERIKAIEAEAKARIDAIAQEAQERITAITAERERAESAEKTEKDERVQAVFEEATERENADTALQSAIDTEAENRESADNALSSRIDDTKADIANAADNLDKENARALEAESALQSAIDRESENREKADTAMTDKLDAMQETIDAIPFTEDGLKDAVDTANAKIGDWVDISAGAKIGAYSKSFKVSYARYRVISPHIIYLDIQAHIELARTLTTEEDCQLIFFPKLQAICAKDNKIREPYPSVTGYVRGTAAVWNPFVVLESGAINGKIKPNVSISSIDINVQSLFCIMGRDMTKFVLE